MCVDAYMLHGCMFINACGRKRRDGEKGYFIFRCSLGSRLSLRCQPAEQIYTIRFRGTSIGIIHIQIVHKFATKFIHHASKMPSSSKLSWLWLFILPTLSLVILIKTAKENAIGKGTENALPARSLNKGSVLTRSMPLTSFFGNPCNIMKSIPFNCWPRVGNRIFEPGRMVCTNLSCAATVIRATDGFTSIENISGFNCK